MKMSEYIKHCEALVKEHGDLEVTAARHDDDSCLQVEPDAWPLCDEDEIYDKNPKALGFQVGYVGEKDL